MEVLDFEVPAEWRLGEDAYPTAPKRLVSSLGGGKKKSNKHISEDKIEDVISKTVRLPVVPTVQAGTPHGALVTTAATTTAHNCTEVQVHCCHGFSHIYAYTRRCFSAFCANHRLRC